MDYIQYYKSCRLCAHACGVDRTRSLGRCLTDANAHVCRIGLHMWEEPIISGTRGSGTVFFSGCSLRCVYCQNNEISRTPVGRIMSVEEIADATLSLEASGAHNINFVTPTHVLPTVCAVIDRARQKGLSVPIVYNTSSYENVDALKLLFGKVDVYLPDLKYYRSETAKKLSGAESYPHVARAAIAEMVRQAPSVVIRDGIIRSGVVVRILLLPGHVAEAKLNVKYLYDTYGDSIYISLMSQYTPQRDMPPPLDRRVTAREYCELVEYADRIGVSNAFIQERSSSVKDYIPNFQI